MVGGMSWGGVLGDDDVFGRCLGGMSLGAVFWKVSLGLSLWLVMYLGLFFVVVFMDALSIGSFFVAFYEVLA